MTSYVTIATDFTTPAYAVWAPVVARVWRSLGHEPLLLLHHHRPAEAWVAAILAELQSLGAVTLDVPDIGWSVANTMRCSRLVAAAAPSLQAADCIMTTDVDMVPVDGNFFSEPAEFVVLRAMYQAWLGLGATSPAAFDPSHMEPAARFRLPMCYAKASAARWRAMIPEIDGGAVGPSLARLVAGRPDQPDSDEVLLSHRFLSSQPGPTVHEGEGRWRRGELLLTDPVTAPLLSAYENLPRGLMRFDEGWVAAGSDPHWQGLRPAPGAVDWIPGRFEAGSRPWVDVLMVGSIHPELREWLETYVERMRQVLP